MDRILVPIDFSPATEVVLANVRTLLRPGDEVLLLHVLEEDAARRGFATTELAAQALDRIASTLEGLCTRVYVDSGDPADRILRAALAMDVHLIAMATHSRRALGRLLFGSVAERVIRESALPVFLIGPSCAGLAAVPGRVLIPLDGSPRAERIIDEIRRLSQGRCFEAVVLHVQPPEPEAPFQVVPDAPLRLKDPLGTYVAAADRLDACGVPAYAVVTRGRIVAGILAEAKSKEAHFIAMTTHGRSGLEAALMGSVAEAVLRASDRPVLILRAQAFAPSPQTSKDPG